MRQAGERGFTVRRQSRAGDDMGPGWTVANAEPRAGDGGLWGRERGGMTKAQGGAWGVGAGAVAGRHRVGVRCVLCT